VTDLINIGSSGLRAYARALATVSDNVANAQTPGYARRSVRMEQQLPNGDAVLYRNQVGGNGVIAAGVTRAVNNWLIEDARVASGDAGRTSARLGWLQATERAVDDGPGGVGASVTALFNRADQFASDPGNTVLRAGFLQAADDAATAFRRTAAGFESAASGVTRAAQGTVDQLNTDIAALQRVNDGLNRAREGSSNQASLLDERDRLLDGIVTAVGATVAIGPRGTATLKVSGETLLSDGATGQITVSAAPSGRLGFGLTLPSGSSAMIPLSGALAGLGEAAGHIADQRTGLDALAAQFATSLNAAHQAGRNATDNPGAALFVMTAGAATLAACALTPADIAASDGLSANGNLLSFASLRGAAGSEANWASLAASQSQSVASARAQDAAASSRRDGAFAARDDVSSVDLDHEAAELLRFQQAYEGSARVIQVARETMQSILNIF
jgi:flagellar hook-associated protein 1